MEKVIDRREYRRNNEKGNIVSDEEIGILQRKIKKILLQSLYASIIFLVLSILKVNNHGKILDSIDKYLDKEITISSLKESGQIILDNASEYYTKLNSAIENIFSSNYFVSTNEVSGEKILFDNENGEIKNMLFTQINSGENLDKSGEIVQSSITDLAVNYESAVEGINQMSEDAKYISENYNMTVPVIGTITSEFGVRNSTNPKVSAYHSGLDIAANTGTQILAALDGEVIEAGTDTYYGKYLKIKKDHMTMIYAHCSKLLVKKGDTIKKGQLIAYVGSTGNSTGPHLHFEIKYQDRLVDPQNILEI